ncbi:hypothetical protein Avbf_12441 [Armadillidium vulgare]|nr:hypothetical protein Avbf_12441 [Armadillidium vulgare]
MAPNFFSSTPKSIPPIGKRESFRSMGMEEELRKMKVHHMISTLNQVIPFIDQDEDGTISVEEFVQIPLIRKALQVDWKDVLVPKDQQKFGSLFRFE